MAHTLIGTLLESAAKMLEGRPLGISKQTLVTALRTTAVQFEVNRNMANAPAMDKNDDVATIVNDLIAAAFDAGIEHWISDDASEEPAQIALLRIQNDLGAEFVQRLKLAWGKKT